MRKGEPDIVFPRPLRDEERLPVRSHRLVESPVPDAEPINEKQNVRQVENSESRGGKEHREHKKKHSRTKEKKSKQRKEKKHKQEEGDLLGETNEQQRAQVVNNVSIVNERACCSVYYFQVFTKYLRIGLQ